MCNHERLLDYLYDEMPASERAAFELHLHECSDCRTELAELGGTRLALASWSPPDSELGFTIVRKTAAEPRRSVWGFRPAWGFAAAAVLVLAVAAGVSNIEVRYDRNGFVASTGWNRRAVPAATQQNSAAAVPAMAASDELMQRFDARLKQLEGDRKVRPATVDDDAPSANRMSDAELLRAVRKIIADSEARQQRELAFRITQVVRDGDAARAGDLARVEQGLRQIQGLTDAELILHRDTLNHLLRVTKQR